MVLADASSSQNAKFYLMHLRARSKSGRFLFMEDFEPNVKLAIEAAARSLARCEQCRASLERKLLQKEFDEDTIKQALDFLESKKYLDDARYAASWIRSHCAYKPRGSIRLVRELCARGVSRDVAANAVADYFETVDEYELCCKACQKLILKNKNEKNILKSLADAGFSYKIIQRALKN